MYFSRLFILHYLYTIFTLGFIYILLRSFLCHSTIIVVVTLAVGKEIAVIEHEDRLRVSIKL